MLAYDVTSNVLPETVSVSYFSGKLNPRSCITNLPGV